MNNSYIYIYHVNVTQTVPDISPLMPMHQDPLLVQLIEAWWHHLASVNLVINGSGNGLLTCCCLSNLILSYHNIIQCVLLSHVAFWAVSSAATHPGVSHNFLTGNLAYHATISFTNLGLQGVAHVSNMLLLCFSFLLIMLFGLKKICKSPQTLNCDSGILNLFCF